MDGVASEPALIFRSGGVRCALPLAAVDEVLRPLPVTPLSDVPACVRGAAVIRGAPTPVIDLAHLVFGGAEEARRLVSVRVGGRRAALAVGETLGVIDLGELRDKALPPLLSDTGQGAVAKLGALDRELCVVLESAFLVPDAAWAAIEAAGRVAESGSESGGEAEAESEGQGEGQGEDGGDDAAVGGGPP